MSVTPLHWIGFNLLILVLLSMELYRFYRHPRAISIQEALLNSAGWILLAFAFNFWIYFTFGHQQALDFLTGYLVEKSLSIDNLFVILLIFAHFNVPETSKHQVLFFGVLGAIVLRALLIWGGIVLIAHFHGILLFFGLFLIVAGIRLFFKNEDEQVVEKSRAYQWLKRWIPLTSAYHGQAFFIRQNGQWAATPLLAVLILIETTDLVFALDSVPAILGITTEPFIVYTSNIFAILGLRSLFFALEGMMKSFHLIHYALAFILIFIGCKMLVADFLPIPTWITLIILISALSLAAIGSYISKKNRF